MTRRSLVSFTEYYLRNLDKLEALAPETQRRFWSQREWHPIVQMMWVTLTHSNGEGLITYPDGTRITYQVKS